MSEGSDRGGKGDGVEGCRRVLLGVEALVSAMDLKKSMPIIIRLTTTTAATIKRDVQASAGRMLGRCASCQRVRWLGLQTFHSRALDSGGGPISKRSLARSAP